MDLQKRSFGSADEIRPMADKGRVEILRIGDGVVGNEPCVRPDFTGMEHFAD